jgi:hypothetical protein
VDPVEIHEYLVLKYDGSVEHFPVVEGDVAQAKEKAVLCQRPGDALVLVTGDAYIRVREDARAEESARPAAPGVTADA